MDRSVEQLQRFYELAASIRKMQKEYRIEKSWALLERIKKSNATLDAYIEDGRELDRLLTLIPEIGQTEFFENEINKYER